jgi:hypothetical protein
MQNDERFWAVTALLSIFGAPYRVRSLAGVGSTHGGTGTIFAERWNGTTWPRP